MFKTLISIQYSLNLPPSCRALRLSLPASFVPRIQMNYRIPSQVLLQAEQYRTHQSRTSRNPFMEVIKDVRIFTPSITLSCNNRKHQLNDYRPVRNCSSGTCSYPDKESVRSCCISVSSLRVSFDL